MSYYGGEPAQGWNPPASRQASWEQPQPPSRSGTIDHTDNITISMGLTELSGASSTVNRDEVMAFASQFEEVDRAAENLLKSGKFGFPAAMSGPGRRDSMPVVPPNPRMGGGPQRHHSVSEYDGMRPHSTSNVQGYYQSQRFAPRPNDADQMAQAKRRMAAQRERELRNYHQEQQYQRNVSGAKSDRSLSPNTMSEEERRELIARQHRALYGDNSSLYTNNPTSSQDVRVNPSGAGRGPSPLAFDPFGTQTPHDSAVQMPSRDKETSGGAQEARTNSNSSPSANQNPTFSLYESTQQASRTSNSSPGGSPPRQGVNSTNGSGVAPIGTRPAMNQGQPAGAPLNKRSTTPLPSPLSYSYNASGQSNGNNNERSTSAASNPATTAAESKNIGLGWGSNSGVWGPSKNSLGVQAPVWG